MTADLFSIVTSCLIRASPNLNDLPFPLCFFTYLSDNRQISQLIRMSQTPLPSFTEFFLVTKDVSNLLNGQELVDRPLGAQHFLQRGTATPIHGAKFRRFWVFSLKFCDEFLFLCGGRTAGRRSTGQPTPALGRRWPPSTCTDLRSSSVSFLLSRYVEIR